MWLAASAALIATLLVSTTALAGGVGDAFTRALAKGPVYAALAAFVGGLGTSLTPCVYPMIGITVAVFGARQAKSRLQAMALSSSFVAGIVTMYTPLGVIAGLTGSLFGSALSNRWVVVAIAAIFVALALSMFGVFELVLPSKLTNKAATIGGAGYIGGFLLGLVSGIVAAPCTGPVLGAILVWIGKTQSAGLGGLMMLLFALGLGVPFWIVGTFAISLPKSGKWMNAVKAVFGIGLLVGALYFLKNAFPQAVRLIPPRGAAAIVAGAAAILGLALGAVHLGFDEGPVRTARKIAGIVLTTLGLAVLVSWLEMPKGEPLWMDKEKEALVIAQRDKRPMVIDFTAEWCPACKKLARVTFSDPVVANELSRFVLLRIDATVDDDPQIVDVQGRYKVAGLPTVIVLDSEGNEAHRLADFVGADEFYGVIRDVR